MHELVNIVISLDRRICLDFEFVSPNFQRIYPLRLAKAHDIEQSELVSPHQ
jgi:hypothetical protein